MKSEGLYQRLAVPGLGTLPASVVGPKQWHGTRYWKFICVVLKNCKARPEKAFWLSLDLQVSDAV